MDDDRYGPNEPAVISEAIEGETIVLNFETGHYFSFNPSAGEIWRAVNARCTLDTIAAALARRFSIDAAAAHADAAAFLLRLADEKLVRPLAAGDAPADPPPAAPDGAAPGAYAPPSFDKFTDMEDMLLLDPIHEVSDAGWPRKSA